MYDAAAEVIVTLCCGPEVIVTLCCGPRRSDIKTIVYVYACTLVRVYMLDRLVRNQSMLSD